MEGYGRKDDGCPQLLDLISKESREWLVKRGEESKNSDEKKLELSLGLGPPGCDWRMNDSKPQEPTWLELTNHKFSSSPWPTTSSSAQQQPFLQLQKKSLHVKPKESSQPCCSMQQQQPSAEKKAFLPATAAVANTAVSNSAQKRSAPAPVVGWPPIRSFRKNLASSNSSSKSASESPNVAPNKGANEKKPIENNSQKGMFVKINMDCIPIGRKVDLKAYDSYEMLSAAVDQLFRGLLAAQSDSSACGIENKDEGEKAITGLLDGSGEYTLVYEDNEGDRMLVGDVPWHMFVSTVKRLRVLKSSELPMLRRERKHGKLSHSS